MIKVNKKFLRYNKLQNRTYDIYEYLSEKAHDAYIANGYEGNKFLDMLTNKAYKLHNLMKVKKWKCVDLNYNDHALDLNEFCMIIVYGGEYYAANYNKCNAKVIDKYADIMRTQTIHHKHILPREIEALLTKSELYNYDLIYDKKTGYYNIVRGARNFPFWFMD